MKHAKVFVRPRSRFVGALSILTVCLTPAHALAQSPARGADVDLPLAVYDDLRERSRAKREEAPRAAPWSALRLLRAHVSLDPSLRRATWEAELEARGEGDEPPALTILRAASSVSRVRVLPEIARLEADGNGARLSFLEAGIARVTLSGEIAGAGPDETAGFRFSLPVLASVPASFEVTGCDGETRCRLAAEGAALQATGAGSPARVVLDGARPATLLVRRERRGGDIRADAPARVTGQVTSTAYLRGEKLRADVRLTLRVRRGLLTSRKLLAPGASLVAVHSSGVEVSAPAPDGTIELTFTPPVPEGQTGSVFLSLYLPFDAASDALRLDPPRFLHDSDEPISTLLTLVADSGVLAVPEPTDRWSRRVDVSDVRRGPDESVQSFSSDADEPLPIPFTLRRLRPLAVATALARADVQAWVSASGLVRTRLTADVRSSGRQVLRFRVPEGATLIAARVDGKPALVSRPAPDRLELPVDAEGGRTRVELLVDNPGDPPRAGQPLTLVAPAPDEPLERVSWSVVLPPSLRVKEQGRTLPAPLEPRAPEPLAPGGTARSEAPAQEVAFAFGRALADADARSRARPGWSAEPSLPGAPVAYRTDLADVGDSIAPLTLTLLAQKEKEPWF